MVCDDRVDPPRFANAGAVRCTNTNVVKKGADTCDNVVRDDKTFRRNEELGLPGVFDMVVDASLKEIIVSLVQHP